MSAAKRGRRFFALHIMTIICTHLQGAHILDSADNEGQDSDSDEELHEVD